MPRGPLRAWSAFLVARRWHPPLPWQSTQILQSLRAWRHGVPPSRRQQPPSGRSDARCGPQSDHDRTDARPIPCASEHPRDTADPPTRRTGHAQHDTYHGVRTTGYGVARAHADVTAVSYYARENRMVWKESPERWRATRKPLTAAGCDHRSSLLLSWHPACATSAGLGAEAGPANRPSLANSRLPMGFVSIALMTRLPSMSADLVPLTRRYSMPSSPWIWMSDGPTVRRR